MSRRPTVVEVARAGRRLHRVGVPGAQRHSGPAGHRGAGARGGRRARLRPRRDRPGPQAGRDAADRLRRRRRLDNPVYAEMMRGVEAGHGRLGRAAARLLDRARPRPTCSPWCDSLSRGYADGLIISPLRRTPELIDALVDAPVPVVVIGDSVGNAPLDTVRTDSRLGVRLAHAAPARDRPPPDRVRQRADRHRARSGPDRGVPSGVRDERYHRSGGRGRRLHGGRRRAGVGHARRARTHGAVRTR